MTQDTTSDTVALSPRHQRFVHEYLKDGNATQAYIRAGYSARGAQSCSSRLLAQPRIQSALAAGRERVAQTLQVTVERLAQEYAKIAFASVDDFVTVGEDGRPRIDLMKASQAQRAGVVEITITDRGANHGRSSQTVKLKLNKLQALAALTKHVELFTKRPEPGLTSEDRARYEAKLASNERDWQHLLAERRRLERERDEARTAQAAAEAKLAQVAPPRTVEEALRPLQAMAPAEGRAASPRYPLTPPTSPVVIPALHPNGRVVWTSRSAPLEPLDEDCSPRVECEYDIYGRE